MDLCSICYFVVILFSIERKWLLMRNLARILPLKSKLTGKFQLFSAIALMELLKCWKRVEFPKISIKMKNFKTFCKAQTASRLMEIVQPPTKPNPTQIKSNYIFGTKIFLRRYVEVYGHLLSTCFENRVLECQEMVQRKFPDTKQKHVFWKIWKVRKISGWLWDFLLENLKLKKTLMMSSRAYGGIEKVVCPK